PGGDATDGSAGNPHPGGDATDGNGGVTKSAQAIENKGDANGALGGKFSDQKTLNLMQISLHNNVLEGSLPFKYHGEDYYGLYKYNPSWNAFLIRGEELNEFYQDSQLIFRNISLGITKGIHLF
ncbi:MAG TPA: hypothetical protein VHY08_05635, partial [Bacillota bacterium]|nr:hypothetical protein [Bacillota bacterium]